MKSEVNNLDNGEIVVLQDEDLGSHVDVDAHQIMEDPKCVESQRECDVGSTRSKSHGEGHLWNHFST